MEKLDTDIQKEAAYKAATFMAFWVINATTTYLFGALYVSSVWGAIVTPLPISSATQANIAALLGGLSALAVLDIAYLRWGKIQLTASSIEQFNIAKTAKVISFVLSLVYTAIVLFTTSFSSLLSAELIGWLDVFGAVSFVGVVVAHLLFAHLYKESDPAHKAMAERVKLSGYMTSEQMAYKSSVTMDALRGAKGHAQQHKQRLVDSLGEAWGHDLINGLNQPTKKQIELVTAGVTPVTTDVTPVTAGVTPVTADVTVGFVTPSVTKERQLLCQFCNEAFTSTNGNAKFCSDRCRVTAYRNGK